MTWARMTRANMARASLTRASTLTALLFYLTASAAAQMRARPGSKTCEGKTLSLSCGSGQQIDVVSANYGRLSRTLCQHTHMSNTNCRSSNSLNVVKARCQGHSSCSVPATNSVFGDPCWGTYKYLEVNFSCKPEGPTKLKAISATMSSTYGTAYPAGRCIDGGEGGRSSLCHSNGEKAPWLALEFVAEVSVEKIVIHNRDDCCGDRLRNAEVWVADQLPTSGQQKFSGGQHLASYRGPGRTGEVITLTSSAQIGGRFVIIQIDHRPGTGYLNFNEVTVWGKETGPASLLTGQFELSTGGSNDWHYVTITEKSGNDFIWTNRAGVSWTITFTSTSTSLTSTSTTLRFSVGSDCPYYSNGYTEGKLYSGSDKGVQIEGPGLQLYTKISSAPQTTIAPTTGTPPPGAPPSACDREGSCSLRTNWGDQTSLDHVTGSIFVVWWDRKFDHEEDARFLIDFLANVRTDCLTNLGMSDPPNPAAGYFFNVYIHHNKDDLFPESWGNGVGTDPWGVPFFTAPYGSIRGESMWHEGFHIFQYRANSPGFAYSGDSMWFIESSAQWYMAQQEAIQGDKKLYVDVGAIIGNPQLALWHSFNNQAPQDPNHSDGRPGWMYGVRQYGMHSLLIYLTTVAKIDRAVITDGFYANTDLSPQEYMSRRVGPAMFRAFFADWAAHNSARMDYITRDQYARALLEISLAGDWDTFRPAVWTGQDQGTSGWASPPPELAVRGWAYNVWNVTNTQDTTYHFQLQGDSAGSEGGQAAFEGRVVIMQTDGEARFLPLEMATALQGSISLDVSASDEQVLFCVVSVPENFGSYQTYGYKAVITKG